MVIEGVVSRKEIIVYNPATNELDELADCSGGGGGRGCGIGRDVISIDEGFHGRVVINEGSEEMSSHFDTTA